MACEAPVIASKTAPVQEVVRDGVNGRLVDFWDTKAIATEVCSALQSPADRQAMRRAARRTVVARYELSACVLRLQALLSKLPNRSAQRQPRLGPVAGRRNVVTEWNRV